MRGRSAILLLNQKEVSNQMKVQKFLESISRSSLQTMKVYKIGLSYFQTFLKDTFKVNYTLESILDALSTNELNVYRLIDEFVSYILNHSKEARLSSSSLRVYLAAVRSYLAYYDIDIVTTKFKRKVKIPKYCREDEHVLTKVYCQNTCISNNYGARIADKNLCSVPL
jgi:site-specific recombinase XerC